MNDDCLQASIDRSIALAFMPFFFKDRSIGAEVKGKAEDCQSLRLIDDSMCVRVRPGPTISLMVDAIILLSFGLHACRINRLLCSNKRIDLLADTRSYSTPWRTY